MYVILILGTIEIHQGSTEIAITDKECLIFHCSIILSKSEVISLRDLIMINPSRGADVTNRDLKYKKTEHFRTIIGLKN